LLDGEVKKIAKAYDDGGARPDEASEPAPRLLLTPAST